MTEHSKKVDANENTGDKSSSAECRLEQAPDVITYRNASDTSVRKAMAANPDIWTSGDGIFAITDGGATVAQQKGENTASVETRKTSIKQYAFEQPADAQGMPIDSSHGEASGISTPETFLIADRGRVTKLSNGKILDWPNPNQEYKLGTVTYKANWQPGQPLPLDPGAAVGTVINWVNTFSAANPNQIDHDTGNALRHVLCPALLMNQYKWGHIATAYVLDCANIIFEGQTAIEAALPALMKGNFKAAGDIVDWKDTDKDLVNATAGINLGVSNPFSSAEDICGKSIEAAFQAGKNNGKVPNTKFFL